MREITTHKVNGCNEQITVSAVDAPGHGGACHVYALTIPYRNIKSTQLIEFQNGPIKEAGVNGYTHEALLAILQDRLEGFQSGPYKSDDNQEALDAIKRAQAALQRRTLARVARGVEGTHTV